MKRIESIIDGPFRNGVITNMPRDEYNAACGLNPSSITEKSLKHTRHAYQKPYGESTDDQLRGIVGHILTLEPHKLDEKVAVWEGGTRRSKAWDEFCGDTEGMIRIRRKEFDEAIAGANAITSDPLAVKAIGNGIGETAVFTSEFDVQCRGLLDWINTDDGILVDLKWCHDIEAHVFGKTFHRFGYDQKLACYLNWFRRESGKNIREVKLICVESTEPWDVAVVPIDINTIEWGWTKAQNRIQDVRLCIETGFWPGVAGNNVLDSIRNLPWPDRVSAFQQRFTEEYFLHQPHYAIDEQEVGLA